ncbi:MAG: sensor domain-containing protein [Mycobacterium sp.]
MTEGVFLSYSSRDREQLDNLLSALRRADEQVWFDDELGGGDEWWKQILGRIRDCDVFLFALSDNSLQSKPCLTELRYAQALQKAVLPIQIGPVASMRISPLAAVEAIDFQNPTVDSGIRLITAIQRAKQRNGPLPSPLPDEPPVPYAYLMRLAATITGGALDPQQQGALLSELKTVVAQDGDDTTAHRDIAQLLQTLRDRPDATDTTRTEAANLIAALGNTSQSAKPQPGRKIQSRKWMAVAAATVAVIAAVVAVVVTRERPGSTAAPVAAPSSSSTTAPVAPSQLLPAKLESTLLSAEEVNTVMGATGIKADGPITDGLSAPSTTPSDPNCLGAGDAAVDAVYKDSGWIAAREQILSQPSPDDPNAKTFWVDQAAVGFPTARQAQDFLNSSANRWTGCSRRTIAEKGSDGDSTSWAYGDLVRDNDTVSLPLFQEGGDDWGCQHTLSAYSNIVLEAVACAFDVSDQGARVVAKMAEKAKG